MVLVGAPLGREDIPAEHTSLLDLLGVRLVEVNLTIAEGEDDRLQLLDVVHLHDKHTFVASLELLEAILAEECPSEPVHVDEVVASVHHQSVGEFIETSVFDLVAAISYLLECIGIPG